MTREAGLSWTTVAGSWGKAALSLPRPRTLHPPLLWLGPYLPSWNSPSFMHLVVMAALKSGSRSSRLLA